MTQANRNRKFYMSRRVPGTRMGTFFSVILAITVIIIVVAVRIYGVFDLSVERIFGPVGICIAGIIMINAFIGRSAMQDMEKGRTTTSATVIDRYVKESAPYYGGTISTYYIVFRFISVEKEWTLKAIVCRKLYDKASQCELSMIYANSDPRCILFKGEY